MNLVVRKIILINLFILFIFGGNVLLKDDLKISLEKATFGAGCFWCIEAIFERLDGVFDVVAGYSGGETVNPTYEEVCSGKTGHAEVIQILFDPKIISYEKLLRYFWGSHDPTSKNRQGADIGTQYRSAVYYHSEEQKRVVGKIKLDLEKKKIFNAPIVTEISPIKNYYRAEKYHQNYYKLNSNAPYCQTVIKPKLDKIFNK